MKKTFCAELPHDRRKFVSVDMPAKLGPEFDMGPLKWPSLINKYLVIKSNA